MRTISRVGSTGAFGRRDDLTWIAAFVAVRMIVIGAFYWVAGGNELASDFGYHKMIIDAPFAILSGTADPHVASYPPLQFLVEWPLYRLFELFAPAFVAIRLTMVTVELVGFVLFLGVLRALAPGAGFGRVARLLYVFGPHQLLTSCIFVQEEVISQAIIVAAALLLVNARTFASLFVLAVGALVAKIFFVVPLFYVALFGDRRPRSVLPFLLVIGVSASGAWLAVANGGVMPLLGFKPNPEYGSLFWALLVNDAPESIEAVRRQSLALTLAAQVGIGLFWLHRSRMLSRPLEPLELLTFPLAVFLFTFYLHNPEYTLLFWPICLLARRRTSDALFLGAVAAFAWVPNILFGLKNIGLVNSPRSADRNALLQPLIERLGVDFATLHQFAIVVYTVLYLIMLVVLWRGFGSRERDADPAPARAIPARGSRP